MASAAPCIATPFIEAMPDSATSVPGCASRCRSVGISVWPPPSAWASSMASAASASSTVFGFTNSNAYMSRLPHRAAWIAAQTRDGVSGMSMCSTSIPPPFSASSTALTSAGGEPIAPASPQPFTPSGLWVQGVTHEWSTTKLGTSAARGIA